MNWWSRLNVYWIISLLYMGLIFLFSSSPSPIELPSFSFADKLAHFLEYGLLASLICFALGKSQANTHPVFFPFLFALLYGLSDEFHQYFIPGRDADLFDAVADGVGSFIFPLVIYAIKDGRMIRFLSKER